MACISVHYPTQKRKHAYIHGKKREKKKGGGDGYIGLVLESFWAAAFLRLGEACLAAWFLIFFNVSDLSCLNLVHRSPHSLEVGVKG